MPKLTDAEWAAKRKQLQIAAGDDGWPTLGEIRNARWIEALWLVIRELHDRISELEEKAAKRRAPRLFRRPDLIPKSGD